MDIVLLLLALVGHAFLWVAFVNRMHSVSLSHRANRAASCLGFSCLGLIAVGFGLWFYMADLVIVGAGTNVPWPGMLYLGVCWVAAVVAVVRWIGHLRRPVPDVLRYHRSRLVDPFGCLEDTDTAPGEHHLMVRLPGNEILQLDVAERALEVPRLAANLDRLTIVHLSDLHFTGRVGKAYFQEVVRLSNQLQPDLVAITGDVVDRADCIDWIPDTLGKLTSRHGAFFVLGNHDLKALSGRIRRTLTDSGLIDLGGRWMEIHVGGATVVLAGNELPWFPPAADLQNAPPCSADGGPLRIGLSHTPDQLHWAQANCVDLLLAGHMHGGQIRIPLIGPILAPSRTGVKYSCGVFHAPPTIMHVTRGISGEYPIRMNCPPEIVKLVLHTEERGEGPGIGD